MENVKKRAKRLKSEARQELTAFRRKTDKEIIRITAPEICEGDQRTDHKRQKLIQLIHVTDGNKDTWPVAEEY